MVHYDECALPIAVSEIKPDCLQMRPTTALSACLLTCLLQCTGLAIACPVCMPLPQQTLADQLIAAEVVALGREDPQRRFSFTAIAVLKGELPDPHIDLFVDSFARRRLNADGDCVAMLIQTTGGQWTNLGIADPQLQTIVRRVLAFAPKWTGQHGSRRRLEYFLSLWGHKNRTIFELSYLELGKAPYPFIQQFSQSVSPQELQPILTDRNYLAWRPLAILMLGQHTDDGSRKLICESFASYASTSSTTNLSAWTTAYLEQFGNSAINVIDRKYLQNTSRSRIETEAVLKALSVYGHAADLDGKNRIAESYREALKTHPYTIVPIVNDLAAWEIWENDEEIARILATQRPFLATSEISAINRYLNKTPQ